MMFTGWVLALVTGVYNALVGIASMALGLLTLVLIVVGLDQHRKNVSVLTRVAAVAMVAVLVFVTAFFWMSILGQVTLSMLCGSVAVVLFCYCLISPLVSDWTS